MTVLSLSNKHASNWQNFLLVRKCLTLSEAQTWSLAGRLKRQRQVVLQKAVDYQYPGFIETTGDPVKQTDDNVTIRCAFYPHLIFQYQRVTFLNYPIFPETDVSDSRLELSL